MFNLRVASLVAENISHLMTINLVIDLFNLRVASLDAVNISHLLTINLVMNLFNLVEDNTLSNIQ